DLRYNACASLRVRLVSSLSVLTPKSRARVSSVSRMRRPTPRPRASAATHMRLTSPIVRSFTLSAPQPMGCPPRRGTTKTPAGGVSSSGLAGMLFAGPHPADAAVVRRRVRLHQPLTLERAQQAADVTGIQLQSRA